MTRQKNITARLANHIDPALPRAQQVARFVRDKIESGVWPQGFKLPPEPRLAADFGIARMTVHSALRSLADEGLLIRRRGAGTFVTAQKPESTFLEIHNIHDEIEARGHIHTARVELLESVSADMNTATELAVAPGTEVFHSILVHLENNRPIQLEDRYVNPPFAPNYLDQDFTEQTPHAYLLKFGTIDEVEHIIQATRADSRVIELLDMDENDAVLLLRRRTWTRNGIVTTARLWHPGQRFSLIGRMSSQ